MGFHEGSKEVLAGAHHRRSLVARGPHHSQPGVGLGPLHLYALLKRDERLLQKPSHGSTLHPFYPRALGIGDPRLESLYGALSPEGSDPPSQPCSKGETEELQQ